MYFPFHHMDLFPATKFAPLIGVTVNVLQGCAFIEHCVPQLSGSTCLTFFYFFIFTIHIRQKRGLPWKRRINNFWACDWKGKNYYALFASKLILWFFSKKIFWFSMLLKKIFWFCWRKKKIIWFRVFVI